MDRINVILSKQSGTARNLASILGKIISLIPAFGNVCQLMSRHVCMSVCQRVTWDKHFKISCNVKAEFEFWLKNCRLLPNGVVSPVSRILEIILFSMLMHTQVLVSLNAIF